MADPQATGPIQQITLPDITVTPQENPLSAGSGGEQPDIIQGQEPTQQTTPPIGDGMIEARLNGYSWPAIDQHTANFQTAAAQAGYTSDQVDDEVGKPAPLDQFGPLPYKELHTDPQFPTQGVTRPFAPGEYMRNMDGSWSSEMSDTVKFDDGTYHNVPGLWLVNGHPTHLNEDQAAEQAQHSGLAFGNAYASEEEANVDAAKREALWQNIDPGSPQHLSTPSLWTGKVTQPSNIPTVKGATDWPIGTVLGALGSGGANVPIVKTAQDNMLKMALRSGTNMQQLYNDSHSDPILQDALLTPGSIGDKTLKGIADAIHNEPAKPTYPSLEDLHEKPLEHVYFGIPFLDMADENGGVTKALEDAGIDAAELVGGAMVGKYIVAPMLTAIKGAVVNNETMKALGQTAEQAAQALKDTFGKVMADESGQLGKPLVRDVKPIPNPLLKAGATDWTEKRGGFMKLEDKLNWMERQNDVEKRTILNMMRDMPEEWADPKFQEKAYLYNETLGTSLHVPDAEMDDYMARMAPLRDRELQLSYRLAALTRGPTYRQIKPGMWVFGSSSEPMPKLQSWDQGYVHRVLDDDATNKLVSQSETGKQMGPLTESGGSLSDWASSAQARHDWFVHDAGNGNRLWGGDLSNTPYKYGDTYKDPLTGKQVTIARPTTPEIETNTPYTYFKNHFINTAENVARLGQSVRNAELVNDTMREMEAMGQYVPWQRVPAGNFGPAGMEQVKADQIAGWAHPQVARALNNYFSPAQMPSYLERSRAFTRFVLRWVFMNPLIHGLNMTQLWAQNRGFDWLNPVGWGRMFKYSIKAFQQVRSFGDDYLTHLQAGASLQRSGLETRNFLSVLHREMGIQIQQNQSGMFGALAKATGIDLPGMLNGVNAWSHKTLWAWQDMLAMSRQYELMDKGMPLQEAIYQSEKDIANYRLPQSVMGSHALRDLLNDPGADMFGRYHYGLMRGLSMIVKDALGPNSTMGERADAVGKATALGFMALGIMPMLNWGLSAAGRAMTGDPNLNIEAGPRGSLVPLMAAGEAVHASFPWTTDAGYKWLRLAQALMSYAPAIEMAEKMGEAMGKAEGLPQKLYRMIEAGGGVALPPFEWAMNAMKPHGLIRTIGQQAGFHIPTPPDVIAKAQKRDAAIVNSQDKHDAFINWMSNLFGTPIPGTGTGSGRYNTHIPSGFKGYSNGPHYSNGPRYK